MNEGHEVMLNWETTESSRTEVFEQFTEIECLVLAAYYPVQQTAAHPN